ncbi:MAG TPA: flagellar basal body P-ring protein FlgI [Burkholderiales bacterium]|nr:flagellar basal body P-ring protein FlgI [Burkholderiales bacterium]
MALLSRGTDVHRIAWATPVSLVLALAMAVSLAHAERIRDLTQVQGVRGNQLVGYGLVVGLDGTGDQTTQTPFTIQSLINMLGQLGVQLPQGTSLQLKNIAAVMVTATLPPFARQGSQIDVTVSSLGNAKSLRSGTLLLTQLKGADGQVYAVAQGNLVVPGAGASEAGSSVQINALNAGRIPNGAIVEREVPMPIGQGEYVYLESNAPDFTTTSRIVDAVNGMIGPDTATAVDGRLIRIKAPVDSTQRVGFLATVENIVVTPSEPSPKVVINARTGSVVMNQLVRVSECAVAHGSLTVVISAQPIISQPEPFSDRGRTVRAEQADVGIQQQKGRLVLVPASASLADLVKALNAVGATPIDMLAILQAMKTAGALKADLEII